MPRKDANKPWRNKKKFNCNHVKHCGYFPDCPTTCATQEMKEVKPEEVGFYLQFPLKW